MTNLSKQDREEKYKLTSKISDPGSICAQKSDFDRLNIKTALEEGLLYVGKPKITFINGYLSIHPCRKTRELHGCLYKYPCRIVFLQLKKRNVQFPPFYTALY